MRQLFAENSISEANGRAVASAAPKTLIELQFGVVEAVLKIFFLNEKTMVTQQSDKNKNNNDTLFFSHGLAQF